MGCNIIQTHTHTNQTQGSCTQHRWLKTRHTQLLYISLLRSQNLINAQEYNKIKINKLIYVKSFILQQADDSHLLGIPRSWSIVRDFSGKKRNCFQTLDSQLLMRATFSNFEKLFSSLQSYELIELCCLSFRPSFRVCVSVSLKNSHMQPLQWTINAVRDFLYKSCYHRIISVKKSPNK